MNYEMKMEKKEASGRSYCYWFCSQVSYLEPHKAIKIDKIGIIIFTSSTSNINLKLNINRTITLSFL